ncbi:hypothetical protein JOF53_007077 [Crossiella equi]|uniref:Uncharacterized protein n=1 Tax=Crossiella equi TaxID=130796 RepID=A0ABS5ANT8_9PSEU|nr:hypothetical protein [Crossiella equi]MBP2478205.1 hypothetical protein [Crossiella equi]
MVEEIGDQADALGGRYATVEKAAAEVSEAIEKWVKVCVTSAPNTSERIGCVIGTLSKVKLGDETILAAMYEVERP